jgi:hypothetical protein
MQTKLLLTVLIPTAAAFAADPPVPGFKAVDIDTKVVIGYGVAVADVNGDKKPDILLADKNLIVWYENPSWAKHVMAEKLTAQDHVCIAAQDIDGDGKCEVAVGAGWNPGDTLNSGAVFYLHPPAERTQKWQAIALPHVPTIHRMRWVESPRGGFELLSVPLHGYGNKNGEGEGVSIMTYRKPADPRQPWETNTLVKQWHKTHNFDTIGPGRAILVGASEGIFQIDRLPGKDVIRLIATNDVGGVGEVRSGNSHAANRFIAAIEPMHGNNLTVYTSAELANPKVLWTRRVLDSSLADGHALACGDLSGIGRDQIVVGWRAMNRPGVKVGIKLFTPLDAEGKQWKQTLVDDNTMACEDLCLADLDGNGKLDIVAAGRATKNLKVYLNQGVGQ